MALNLKSSCLSLLYWDYRYVTTHLAVVSYFLMRFLWAYTDYYLLTKLTRGYQGIVSHWGCCTPWVISPCLRVPSVFQKLKSHEMISESRISQFNKFGKSNTSQTSLEGTVYEHITVTWRSPNMHEWVRWVQSPEFSNQEFRNSDTLFKNSSLLRNQYLQQLSQTWCYTTSLHANVFLSTLMMFHVFSSPEALPCGNFMQS